MWKTIEAPAYRSLVWLTSTLYQLREWLGSGVKCINYRPHRKWLIATFLRTHKIFCASSWFPGNICLGHFCSSCSYVQLQLLLPGVLSCATSAPVRAAWEEALDCKLAEKGLNKSVLLGGEGFPAVSRGYVCRKCYNLLNGYCERRKVVFHNIDQAIEVLKQGTASDTTRDSRARKRTTQRN